MNFCFEGKIEMTATKMNVQGIDIRYSRIDQEDYISLTDIAKYKNPASPKDVVKNWLRSKDTISFLGLWVMLKTLILMGSNSTPLKMNQVIILLLYHLSNGLKRQKQ